VRAAMSITDNCAALGEMTIHLVSTVTDCSLRIQVEVSDLAGNIGGDVTIVRVDPNPPVVAIDEAASVPWYRTVAEATAAVARAAHATDDCNVVTVDAPTLVGSCAQVQASVTARDTCGNVTTGHTVVRIDGTPPTVSIPRTLTNACFTSIDAAEQAVRSAATIIDDCTPVAELDVRVDSTVTDCLMRVRIEAIDHAGNRAIDAVTVRVDTAIPTVEIQRLLLGFKGEVLGFQTPPCYPTVAAAEAAVLAVTRFADNCTPAERISKSVSSSGDPCALLVTVRGTDECLLENTDSVVVRVDAAVPSVSCSVARDRLWPANHDMVDVGFTYSVTDNCPGPLQLYFSVTSDEPTASSEGAGQTSPAPDAELRRTLAGVVTGARLRAERATAGDGRVYRITVRAVDPCGNVGEASCTVSVPPSPNSAAVDSGQYYDATQVN